MKSKEPSQDIDDLYDFETNDGSANIVTNTAENKAVISDIISVSSVPYFPYQYEASLIGTIREIYIDKLDYMVGMVEFRNIFQELGIGSVKNSNDVERINSIYKIIDVDMLEAIKELSDEDITNIGNYTNRVESSSSSIVGFDECVMKFLQQVHVDEILQDVENNNIHRFIELNYQKHNLIIHLYPHKCMVLVAGNMSQFDNLFDAMGIYANYKEYTNSVISEDDILLNEIYEKFVEM